MPEINDMPAEVFEEIMKLVSPISLFKPFQYASVSRKFHQTLSNQSFVAVYIKETCFHPISTALCDRTCYQWPVIYQKAYVSYRYSSHTKLTVKFPSYHIPLIPMNIPQALADLQHITAINLSHSGLITIPKYIGQFLQLTELEIIGIKTPSEIPPGVFSLNRLQKLKLTKCNLFGSIPREIENLDSLVELDLSFNKLSSSVPDEISKLGKLQKLKLNSNLLSGCIPSAIGHLSALLVLRLDTNKFVGEIPKSIGQLQELQDLYLSHNALSGILPESLGKLSSLEVFIVDNNNLSGSLSRSLGNLTKLSGLGLSFNQFSGVLPKELLLLDLFHFTVFGNAFIGMDPKNNYQQLDYLVSFDI
ncbi:UNVERIFIED_CONTAM: hypothetical protein HDU68_008623 [Siphonaria sp. JEL0065]|nr:hypothetical protein HDU68_008623 [Siphonaria sp. JEL0065]